MIKQKKMLKKSELKQFKELLLKHKKQISGNASKLSDKTIGKNPHDASGDISSLPIHMADLGTDAFEHDMNLRLVESTAQELELIEDALERIKKGDYGFCELCKKPIPKGRLHSIPYTRLCIACKTKEEGI